MLDVILLYILWVLVFAVFAGKFCGLNDSAKTKKRALKAIRGKDEIY